jgi:hypothetical protein
MQHLSGDGQLKADNVCSNCLMNRIDCTYNNPVPQVRPSKIISLRRLIVS